MSTNRQKFLDIYSYDLNLTRKGKKIVANPQGEQTVELYDLETGKTGRMLFCGISEQIQEVIWIANTKCIFVGREIEEDGKVYPIIYIADLSRKTLTCFRSSNKSSIEKKNPYSSPKLETIKFQEE